MWYKLLSMKPSLIALFVLFGLTVAGQDDEFERGMKAVKGTMDFLAKAEKKSGREITSAGERLGYVYENMIPYWRARDAADAVKLSEAGKAAATLLASASFGKDEAKVDAAIKEIGATCKGCHDAHRERTPEGKFKIK